MPALVTDTMAFTSDEAGTMAELFTQLCRARRAYGLEPQALAEVVSVLAAEVLGRLLALHAEAAGLSVGEAQYLEDWACDTQHRALAVARACLGEGEA